MIHYTPVHNVHDQYYIIFTDYIMLLEILYGLYNVTYYILYYKPSFCMLAKHWRACVGSCVFVCVFVSVCAGVCVH